MDHTMLQSAIVMQSMWQNLFLHVAFAAIRNVVIKNRVFNEPNKKERKKKLKIVRPNA